MYELSSRQYDSDDVNRIIRRALKLDNEDTIRHEDLLETAKAIGLDSQIVEAAIEQEQWEFEKEKFRKVRLKRRKVGFYSHLWSYLIVNSALLLINNFTPGPWWFQWPVLGWGIGLVFYFKVIYFTIFTFEYFKQKIYFLFPLKNTSKNLIFLPSIHK